MVDNFNRRNEHNICIECGKVNAKYGYLCKVCYILHLDKQLRYDRIKRNQDPFREMSPRGRIGPLTKYDTELVFKPIGCGRPKAGKECMGRWVEKKVNIKRR